MLSVVVNLAFLVAVAAANSAPASATTTSGFPTVSLFLPMADTSQALAASIVMARPNGTVYAIGCLTTTDAADCGFNPPVTITEDQDSLRFTMSYQAGDDSNSNSVSADNMSSTTSAPIEVTSDCQIFGSPRATSAVCTGKNAVSGLGNAASSTTLASSEINYMPVVITAGAQKTALPAATSGSSTAGSSTISGNGAAVTAVQNLAIGAGLAAVGILI